MNKVLINLIALCFLAVPAQAQMKTSDALSQLIKDADLTDGQIRAVVPIIQASLQKREAYLNKEGADAFPDKRAINAALLKFRDEDDRQLSKVLSEEQMKKLIAKRRIRQRLNKDKVDFSQRLTGSTMGLEGATMSF